MLATRFGDPNKCPEPEAHVFRRLSLLSEIPSKLLIGTVPINAHAGVVSRSQGFTFTNQESELCGIGTKRGGRLCGRLRACRRPGGRCRRSRAVAKVGETNAVLPQGADLLAGQFLQLCDGQIEVECRANRISGIIGLMTPCKHETRVAGSAGAQDELRVGFISVNRPDSLGRVCKTLSLFVVAFAVLVRDHSRSGDVGKNERLVREISETDIYLENVVPYKASRRLRGRHAHDFCHEGTSAVATRFPGTRVYHRCRSNRGHGSIF